MSVSPNEPKGGRSAPSEEMGKLYQLLTAGLLPVLRKRFGIDEATAKSLLDNACYAYLQVGAPTSQPEAWLNGLLWTNAEQLYGSGGAADREDIARSRERLATLKGLSRLLPIEQTALRLQLYDGLTNEEIAREMNISVKYVERLLERANDRLRGWNEPEAEEP